MSGKPHTEETKLKIAQTMKGRKPKHTVAGWNKGIPMGKTDRENLSRVMRERGIKPTEHFVATGEAHPLWKGDAASYSAIHYWVRRFLGKPSVCKHCGESTRRLTWANKDHKYKRVAQDWISLCYSCHKKFDLRCK